MAKLIRPKFNDYPSYYDAYLRLINEDDLNKLLREGLKSFPEWINQNINADWNFQYQDGKWTSKEILHHLLDTERILTYRSLCISRDDKTHMPGFDQTGYIEKVDVSKRTVPSLLTEYKAIRNASLSLFKNMNKKEADRIGYSNGMNVTARSLGYVIIGHQRHHINVLKELYNFN
ncbi:MAG TPA: DinB family protein [Saprospiraceae bacterium]|nr:DinB family protein [Saprospiraceae bacterium]